MKDADSTERQFGEIELKLLRAKLLKEVVEIFNQVSNKDEDFLYPEVDINSPSERMLVMNPLVKGEFMGHLYEICTNGVHPTAYVNCGCLATYDKKEDYDDLPVHGGCTFAGTMACGDGLWVGWDYGHFGDYMAFGPDASPYKVAIYPHGKKWTVSEVMRDVMKAILSIEEKK